MAGPVVVVVEDDQDILEYSVGLIDISNVGPRSVESPLGACGSILAL